MIELSRDTASCTVVEEVIPDYIPIKVVSLDANHNGVVDSGDEAMFLAVMDSVKGDTRYDRQFDANFDGIINLSDKMIFNETIGKVLEGIRNWIKTVTFTLLTWTDGWSANLVALNKNMIKEFTGLEPVGGGNPEHGWISVREQVYRSPSSGDPGYYCVQFSIDTMVAAYKALGYGCLLLGISVEGGHAYIIFWTGGDWHDLSNWQLLEPQAGRLWGLSAADPALSTMYKTSRIYFFDYSDGPLLYAHVLDVNYAYGIIDYGSGGHIRITGCEEPFPAVFDRMLGVGE